GPFGITFPRRPSGRFSDGRVLTDFLAEFLGVKSPIPYSWRKLAPQKAKDGVNFAFGGTGVLNTTATIKVGLPNMTQQIDLFQQILSGNDVVQVDTRLTDAVAYVSLVGNDYNTYLSSGGSIQGLPSFITKVVNQLAVNLERILNLGFRRIIVTGLQPIGCVPQLTASDSFKQCNSTFNSAVQFHNQLLAQAVATLNNQTSETPIHILDLYNSFFSSFQEKDTYTGRSRFETPLIPCCFGIDANSNCGDVDEDGNKLYTLCDDRSAAFFWDSYHPTQAGWEVVYPKLRATLLQALH
ncbi:hypothetical protein LNV47_24425, partial [Paucibacter sp. DJ4R-1]|nr:hypothetical protein [Paucibacter sp. DJ4R-1]